MSFVLTVWLLLAYLVSGRPGWVACLLVLLAILVLFA